MIFKRYLDKHFQSDMFSTRDIFKMLFPLILDSMFINIINMLATSMISSSGQASVAAVSIVNPLSGLILFLFNAIAAGGTVVVAQYKGHGDEKKIREAAGMTLSVTLVLSAVICTLMGVFADPILRGLYGTAEPEVLEKAIMYLSGNSVTLFFYDIFAAVFGIFRGLGETQKCLHLTVFINSTYFVFSYVFLNLMHLDIKGTVLAFLLARIIGAAIAVYYLLFSKKREIKVTLKDLLSFDFGIFKNILRISIPFGSEQIFLYGGSILVQKYVVNLGTVAVAANAIANSMISLAYGIPNAVAALSTTVVGQCVGAGKKQLAKWYGKQMMLLCTALMLISLAAFVPLMKPLLSTFHPEADTASAVIGLIWISFIPMMIFWPFSNTMPYTLRSAGDAAFPSIVSLMTMWIFRVGAGYLAAVPMGFGIEGVWVCMAAEWVVRTFIFVWRFRGEKWLKSFSTQ